MCGQVGDTFLSFVCFVFNMGTNLPVLLGKRSRSWCGFCCSKYEKELAEGFFFFKRVYGQETI